MANWGWLLSDAILQIEGAKQPEPAKVRDYFVTTIGGLEDVALRDLKAHLKSFELIRVEPGRRSGRILFRYDRSPARLLELRSVENLYVLLGDVVGITPGRPGLLRAAKQVASCNLAPGVALHDKMHGTKTEHGFHLTCTVGKDHRFSASEMYQVLDTVLSTKYEVYADDVSVPYRLHFRTGRKRGLFGLQLSKSRLGDRPYRATKSPNDLEASIAYAMAVLGNVQPRDVCLDPFCKDAIPIIEASLGFGPSRLICSSPRGKLSDQAKANLEAAGLRAQYVGWRDQVMELPDGSVDKIITDLRTSEGNSSSGTITGQLFSEFARVLKPRRRAILFTEDEDGVQDALSNSGGRLGIQRRLRINLRGLRPSIFVMKRL